jgi:hypothetical protein
MPMKLEPHEEHDWLSKLMGSWTFENEAIMEPGKPPVKFSGKETVRSLGGLWVLCEGEGEMPGGGVGHTIMTLGYDPAKKRFVGTFIGSMMTNLWIYEGELDAAGKVLTLHTEGPTMAGDGKTAKYNDVIEVKDADNRVLRSNVLGDDGKWSGFMTGSYKRTT